MNLFKNISIRNRLLIKLIIWLCIFIGFGTFAITNMHVIINVTQNIHDYPLQVSIAASKAQVDTLELNRTIKNIMLLNDKAQIQKKIDEINDTKQRVLDNLEIIKSYTYDKYLVTSANEAKDIFTQLGEVRQEVIKLILDNKINEAALLSQTDGENYLQEMESKLNEIDRYSKQKSSDLLKSAEDIEQSQRLSLIILLIVLTIISFILFIMVVQSIQKPISALNSVIDNSASTGNLQELYIEGKNEIVEITKYYNILISKLKDIFWIKDGQNMLNQELSVSSTLDELPQKSISFLSRLMEAGNGVFYIYDKESNSLSLKSSFAYTERDELSNKYELGQGIVGQVALEKRPILLKNIKRNEALITTGTICEAPFNVYAFPLIFENELYGVIELSSFEPFNSIKQEFLNEAGNIISAHLYTTLQNQRIKDLLEISEISKKNAEKSASDLQNANSILEEQQRLLQQQSEELQQTNAELEEQQQLLKKQSEDIQQTNLQLEEQQQQLEEQTVLLNSKNEDLESSRKELLEHSKQLETANKYKSEFLANMSHELRTPLNSIILLSKLLINNERKHFDKGLLDKINIIHKSGQELLRLINDVLDLSKIESGRLNRNITNFNSSEFARELEQLFEGMIKEKNLQFIVNDCVNKMLIGDLDKISQILRNFLSNAIKFTEKGSVTLRIEQDIEDCVVFSVIDTGVGIPRKNFAVIFEEFHQGNGPISGKYGGTGLGLPISKKLSEFMNARIDVESEVGVGSKFSLYVKDMILYNDEDQKDLLNAEPKSQYKIENIDLTDGRDKLLLLIESDENLSNCIKKVNDGMGFNTLIAFNGREGLELASRYEFAGILLDLNLSDMSGMEVLKELKSTPELKQVPIHLISAKDNSSKEPLQNVLEEVQRSLDEVATAKLNPDESTASEKYTNEQSLMDDIAIFLQEIRKNAKNSRYLSSKANTVYSLNLKGKKILIVDDDSRNIFVLASALENYEAEVIDAENGKIALEKLRQHKVDLILMDIMMPVMDGYEAIREIRNDERLKNIPVIALTAKAIKGDKEKCIAAGANDYISKPVDYDVLIRLVKAWIER